MDNRHFKARFTLNSIRAKIVFGFILVCLAVFFSWVSMRIAFSKTLQTMDRMSAPSEKLRVANHLFRTLHQLDQTRRVQTMMDTQGSSSTILSSGPEQISLLLDSLQLLCLDDSLQLERIGYMKDLLLEHEKVFATYLSLRQDVIGNHFFKEQMKYLSGYISTHSAASDSSIIHSQKTTTVTTTKRIPLAKPRQRSFFQKLFGRKPEMDSLVDEQQVKETFSSNADTLTLAKPDSSLRSIEALISDIEKDRDQKSSRLLRKEMKLVVSGNTLVTELSKVLQEIENEELEKVRAQYIGVSGLFQRNIYYVGYILLACLLLGALFVFLLFNDVSRSNVYRRQLLAAKEEAERLGQEKHLFLARMSHEIRTPLQSILGFSEQVQQQEQPDAEYLHAIHSSSEHLLQIVNEVLDYSHIVSGKFSLNQQPFNMHALLKEVSRNIALQAAHKQLRFLFDAGEIPLPYYKGDAFRLRQVLYNLLGNAVKFTYSGEVSLRVKAIPHKSKTGFVLEISDTGPGIAAQDSERIFRAFEQAPGSGQSQSGTGLGLYITRSLVEMQGGTLQLKSEPGKGTVFTVHLTYGHVAENAVVQQAVKKNLHFNGHVMVIDDDQLILKFCSALLSKHHIRHACFSSSEKLFFENAGNEQMVVLTDIHMPGTDGYTVYKKLRAYYGSSIRIVALTAQSLPEEKAALLRFGFDGVLLKPFRENDLLEILESNATLPGAQQAKDSTTPLDLSLLRQMSMNDPVILQETLIFMATDTFNDLEELETALQNNSRQQVTELVHKLAGKTGQAGAYALAALLRKMEKELRAATSLSGKKEKLEMLCTEVRLFAGTLRHCSETVDVA